ncbi:membrane protein [Elstera litoralis]|uniref:Membrane protein n=1 Tax=Elstera litoralis TaxID=552518 RepID=A0A0F3IU63_9PROT|nr:AI-2E family transporter [Elstera litoralis]KJV10290.1 membrane protein [Elstera litoralis]
MSVRKWRWMIGFGLLGLLIVWQITPVLLPFVAGAGIAYFLDPTVDWLERRGVGRGVGTLLTIVSFFLACLLILLLFVPILQGQAVELAQRLPTLLTTIQERVNLWLVDAQRDFGVSDADVINLRAAAGADAGKALGYVAQFVGNLLVGGLAVVNILSLVFVTPVVAFYLLRDWDLIVTKIDSWLPLSAAETIREQAREIDAILSGFARGQALLCLSLGVLYAIGLRSVGLDFGIIIGLLAGLLSFIPFVGVFVGGVTAVGLAVLQFDSWLPVILVAGVFGVGQILEGYVLQPWLVGDRVRLHPVWIIFALLAGGTLFGFLGVLMAVPVMAVIGVLARFGVGQYLASDLYKPKPPETPPAETL